MAIGGSRIATIILSYTRGNLMEYAIAKLKTAEIVGMGAKHLAQIDKICAKHLADTNKSTIFALYINGYGERYYIVQA